MSVIKKKDVLAQQSDPPHMSLAHHRKPRIEVRIASGYEDFQMVVAIRAAVMMGEKEGNYCDHFDANDHCASLLIVLVDGEPAGTLRCRWYADFARIEKMIIRKRFRQLAVLNALVRTATRLCVKKGYTKMAGLALPEVVKFWRRKGGAQVGDPIESVYGPMVPLVVPTPDFDDIEPATLDMAGLQEFEREVYRWEGKGV